MLLPELGRIHNPVNSFEPGESASLSIDRSSDEELLRLCARGADAALEELVRRYQPQIARLLSRLLGSREDVEEALLSVFLQTWQHAPRFRYRARVSTWLYRIAINLAHDIQKQRSRQPQRAMNEQIDAARAQGNAEEEALRRLRQEEQARSLQRALDQLPAIDRTILVLYYYEQMDYEEIQAITQLSYTVLKTRLTRARRRLRQLLAEEDREVGL